MAKTQTSWAKGQSGNLKGCPPGRSKIAKLRKLLEPHAEELVMKAKELAVSGDVTALRLCLERLVPPIRLKDEPVFIASLKGKNNLVEQGQAVINAVAKGEISPGEAATVMQSIANQARIIEVDELEKRLKALEESYDQA